MIVYARGTRSASFEACAGYELPTDQRGDGAGKTQAAEYVRRAQAAGIGWPIPEGIDDTELEWRLFPVAADSANKRLAGDWPAIQGN